MTTNRRRLGKHRQESELSLQAKMLYSILGNVLAPMVGIAAAPILSRGLGADGRGELAAASSPIMLTTAIGIVGLQDALTYYVARHERERGVALKHTVELLLAFGLISTIITWFLATPLSGGNSGLESLIRISAIATIPNFLITIPAGFMAGTQQWRLVAVQSATFGVVRLGAMAALLWTGHLTPRTALLVTVLAPIVASVVYGPALVQGLRDVDRSQSPKTELVARRELLGYGSRIWIGSLSGVVLSRLDQMVMVPLSSEKQLGLYAVAVTVAEIPVILANALRSVVFSADSSELEHTDQDAVDTRLQQVSRLSTQITCLVALAVAGTSWLWVSPVFGADFGGSIHLINVLLLAAIAGAAGSVAGAGLNARNRPGLRSWSMTMGALFNLIVLLIVTPRYGAMGGALSTLVGSAIAGNMNIVWLHMKFGMPMRHFYGVRRSDVELLMRPLRQISARLR